MMSRMLNFFILAGLFSTSLAQCTGNFSNATHQVSVNWTVIGNNSVRFTYTAPANSSQFVALGFATSAFQLFQNDMDVVLAKNNGTSFVQDWWLHLQLTEDAKQNLKDTNTSLNNNTNTLTVNFTRFIISSDTQDLNLTGCRSVVWVYGINNIPTISSLLSNTDHQKFGIFSTKLCLQHCQDYPITPSVTSYIVSTATVTASSTSIGSRSTSTSATQPSSSPPASGTGSRMADKIFVITAVSIVIYFIQCY